MGRRPVMEKRKVSAKALVEDIRSGMSDLELMKKYDLSSERLQTLFKQLLDRGLATEPELYGRSSDLSITVAVNSSADEESTAKTEDEKQAQAGISSHKTKRKVSGKELLADIRSGMSDPEFMQKYRTTAEGLQGLFTKLMARGYVCQAELDLRRVAVDGIVHMTRHREDEAALPLDDLVNSQPKESDTTRTADHLPPQDSSSYQSCAPTAEGINTFIGRASTATGGMAVVLWFAAIHYKGMTVGEALAAVFQPIPLLICLVTGVGYAVAESEFLDHFHNRIKEKFWEMLRRKHPRAKKKVPTKLYPDQTNRAEKILGAKRAEDLNPAGDKRRYLLPRTARGLKKLLREFADYTGTLVHRIKDGLRKGSWCEDRRVVILLLIFLFPVGLYALWKTSKFQIKTKAIIALIALVGAVLLFPKVAILWVISAVTLGIYDLWRHSQLRLIDRGIVTVAIAATVVVGCTLFLGGLNQSKLLSPSKPSKEVQHQPAVKQEKPPTGQSSLGSNRPSVASTRTRQPSPTSSSHGQVARSEDLRPPVYVDPNGFFQIVPPPGWRIQKYPQDPRGKVAFMAPGNQEDLRVLAKVVDIHDYDGLVQSLKTIEKQLGLQTNIEPVIFNGLPAFKRVATISMQGAIQKILWIDLLIAGVSHNLQYGAPPSTFDKHYETAWHSMLTYEPLKRENVSSPEQATKHEAAKWTRLAQIALGMGKTQAARDAVSAGLEADPDNAELKRLKQRLEKR